MLRILWYSRDHSGNVRNEQKEMQYFSLIEETNLQARQVELTEMKLLNEECILFFSWWALPETL